MQEEQASRSHWEHRVSAPWLFRHTQQPVGPPNGPLADAPLVSLPSCPIRVCPFSRVWLFVGVSSGTDGLLVVHLSSPVHILPITALAPLKSKFFVFS